MFVLRADLLGNTSELGTNGPTALVTISTVVPPTDTVRCAISSLPLDKAGNSLEATVEVDEITLSPAASSVAVTVIGLKDYLDDGWQQFHVHIGPCASNRDVQFTFDESVLLVSGWNEHIEFPQISKIVPSASAMVGQQMTVMGRNLYKLYTCLFTCLCTYLCACCVCSHFRAHVYTLSLAGTSTAAATCMWKAL